MRTVRDARGMESSLFSWPSFGRDACVHGRGPLAYATRRDDRPPTLWLLGTERAPYSRPRRWRAQRPRPAGAHAQPPCARVSPDECGECGDGKNTPQRRPCEPRLCSSSSRKPRAREGLWARRPPRCRHPAERTCSRGAARNAHTPGFDRPTRLGWWPRLPPHSLPSRARDGADCRGVHTRYAPREPP